MNKCSELIEALPRVEISYRLANGCDDLTLMGIFRLMLAELHELGNDIVPSERNIDFFWEHVFSPALESGAHGITMAFDEYKPVGVFFNAPSTSRIETRNKQAIAYGIWVDPAYRKQGVALKLQEMSHDKLKKMGIDEVISTVVADNHAGLASCKKAGATITGFLTTVFL